MIRCSQMMLAECLTRQHLQEKGLPAFDDAFRRRLLSYFEDRHDAPLSIHQIVITGAQHSVPMGHWFGASTISHAIKYGSKFLDILD